LATLMVMPQMGYDMHEGKVVRWLKDEGEEVIRGEVIAEIETDKATVEYEAYTGGVMAKIVAEVGATIPVGELTHRCDHCPRRSYSRRYPDGRRCGRVSRFSSPGYRRNPCAYSGSRSFRRRR